MSRALITGASGGIGAEIARLHAGKGGDLVLVARREAELAALKTELEGRHGVEVQTLVEDLSDPAAPARIHAAAPEIDFLINNAGVGAHGAFHEVDLARQQAMVALNVQALTALCHLYLPSMIVRGHGRLLNVSSTAGFLPGPGMAVYFATKAYVTSLSLALAEETRGTGVTVTALCPGPVDTGFFEAASMQGVDMASRALPPARTAKAGYDAMQQGRLIAWDDWRLAVALGWITPLLPRRALLWLSRQAMRKT